MVEIQEDSSKLAIVALAVACLGLAAGPGSVLVNSGGHGEQFDVREFNLYFGLAEDSTEEKIAAFENCAVGKISEAGYGYTLFRSTGGYPVENGYVRGEKTVVVNIVFMDGGFDSTARAFIDAFVDDAKETFGLAAMVSEKPIHCKPAL